MPYIPADQRQEVEEDLIRLIDAIETPGDLNYVITRLIDGYVGAHTFTYSTLNEVVGVLHSAVTEFERRVVSRYEDVKRAAHGDVYPESMEALRNLIEPL